jgi:IS605 OrfB family transposase
MKSMLTIAISRSRPDARDARTWFAFESGDDIIRHKMGYKARRRSLGRQRQQLGDGAKRHGRRRRMSHLTRLEDSEERYVLSKCQEAAAHVVRVAQRNEVSRILVEDWTTPAAADRETYIRQWPWAQLRACIEWAAAKAGIEVESSPGSTSLVCPICQSEGAIMAGNVFLCGDPKCRIERPCDTIFAWNMLRLDGQDVPLEEAKADAKAAADQIRKGVTKKTTKRTRTKKVAAKKATKRTRAKSARSR